MRAANTKRSMSFGLLVTMAIVVASSVSHAATADEPALKGSEARAHLGEDRTVCVGVAAGRASLT